MAKRSIFRSWIIAVLLFTGVGCGTSEEPTSRAEPEKTSGNLATFCEAARELDESAFSEKGHPDDSQLDRFVDAAPPDIKDEAEILVASAREYRAGNDEAASSEEIQAAGDRVDAYLKDNCTDV